MDVDGGRYRRHVPLWALCAAAVLVPLLVPAHARAAVEYSAPIAVSEPGEDARLPQVAIDSRNRTLVAWSRFDGSHWRVQLLRIRPDGTAAAPRTLSPAGMDALAPRVAIDPHGWATVAWHSDAGATSTVQAARVAPDGAVGPVRTISTPAQRVGHVRLAVDSASRTTVVWHEYDGARYSVHAVRLAPDGTPGPVLTLSEALYDARVPEVAVDLDGRATIVWERHYESEIRVRAARLDVTGVVDGIRTLSTAGVYATSPVVASDPAGRMWVAWRRGGSQIETVRLSTGGTPSATTTLSGSGSASSPEMVVDRKGRATLAWHSTTELAEPKPDPGHPDPRPTPEPTQSIRWATLDHPGASPVSGGAGWRAGYPRLAIDRLDTVTVVWDSAPGTVTCQGEGCPSSTLPRGDGILRSTQIGSGGVVSMISDSGHWATAHDVGVDPGGGPTVVWHAAADRVDRVWIAREASLPPIVLGIPDPHGDEFSPPDSDGSEGPTRSRTPTLRIGRRVAVRGRRAVIRVACRGQAGWRCRGRIRVVARVARSASRRRAARRVIARGRYSIPARTRRKVRLRVTRVGRRTVARRRRIRARVVVDGHARRVVAVRALARR